MAYRRPSIALSADMFHRSRILKETRISVKEYNALLTAARAKQKMPEFYKWLDGRKIIFTGES